jgi:hypothetical protein
LCTPGDQRRSASQFGALLGVLYHRCDDMGDVKGLETLNVQATHELWVAEAGHDYSTIAPRAAA